MERRRGRRMLASMHAAFSFGAMTGAGGGALAAAAGLEPGVHLAAVAALVWRGGGARIAGLPRGGARWADRPSRARPARSWRSGAAAFCVLLAEGSVTDWSAVFLNDEAGASEALAAAGLMVFSLTMALGRLAGDRLAERFGPERGGPRRQPAGRGGPGAGPGDGRARGRDRRLRPDGHRPGGHLPADRGGRGPRRAGRRGPAIAAVSGAGYVGLMAGPATIGLVSEAAGVRSALIVVVALCAAAAVAAAALGDN